MWSPNDRVLRIRLTNLKQPYFSHLKPLKIIGAVLLVGVLTLLTQVGGLVYLGSLLVNKPIRKRTTKKGVAFLLKFSSFIILYLVTTLLIVPLLAKPFGRVPLPLTETRHLRPINVLTCVLNRHYVRPELGRVALDVAESMNEKYPGAVVNYLDANFPFFNGFPLMPHLSHKDGKKLDLAFCYQDSETQQPTNRAPSFIGYGICEEPLSGEENTAAFCAEKGYWQYSVLKQVVPQSSKSRFLFDAPRTQTLVQLFAARPAIGKIFIEPHLKSRLHLSSPKIRFHGCRAVRHDDHLHVQLN